MSVCAVVSSVVAADAAAAVDVAAVAMNVVAAAAADAHVAVTFVVSV